MTRTWWVALSAAFKRRSRRRGWCRWMFCSSVSVCHCATPPFARRRRSEWWFDALDVAIHDARSASEGESGRLVVGYPSSLAYSGLTELLRAFQIVSNNPFFSNTRIPTETAHER